MSEFPEPQQIEVEKDENGELIEKDMFGDETSESLQRRVRVSMAKWREQMEPEFAKIRAALHITDKNDVYINARG